MMKNSKVAAGLAASLALILAASPVAAQMFERAYSFTGRDRASLAVVMKQAESGMFDGNVSSGGGDLNYNVTNLVCGGSGSQASATANSACTILNNSAGNTVGSDQDSAGNQDAQAQTNQTVNGAGDDDLSAALDGLTGDSTQ